VTANSLAPAPAHPAGLLDRQQLRLAAPAAASCCVDLTQHAVSSALRPCHALLPGRPPAVTPRPVVVTMRVLVFVRPRGERARPSARSERADRRGRGGARLPPITSRREAHSPANAFLNRGFAFQAPAWQRCGLHQVRRVVSAPCSEADQAGWVRRIGQRRRALHASSRGPAQNALSGQRCAGAAHARLPAEGHALCQHPEPDQARAPLAGCRAGARAPLVSTRACGMCDARSGQPRWGNEQQLEGNVYTFTCMKSVAGSDRKMCLRQSWLLPCG